MRVSLKQYPNEGGCLDRLEAHRPIQTLCGWENDSGSVPLHLVREDIYTGEPKQHYTDDEEVFHVEKKAFSCTEDANKSAKTHLTVRG